MGLNTLETEADAGWQGAALVGSSCLSESSSQEWPLNLAGVQDPLADLSMAPLRGVIPPSSTRHLSMGLCFFWGAQRL